VVSTEELVRVRKSEQEELSPPLRSKEETFFDLWLLFLLDACKLFER